MLPGPPSAARLDEVVAEMTDRYGEPPEQVANLIAVARFRLLARAYGLTDVSMQGKHLRFSPLALPDSRQDRKSTRLNSSHANISYAVFCLKKKKNIIIQSHTGPRPT